MRVDLPKSRAMSPELAPEDDQRDFRRTVAWSLVGMAIAMALFFLTVVFGAVSA